MGKKNEEICLLCQEKTSPHFKLEFKYRSQFDFLFRKPQFLVNKENKLLGRISSFLSFSV